MASKKREEWVDQEIAERKRSKMAQAEHNLEIQSRRERHREDEEDWMGLNANAAQIRAFTEDAVDGLEEHQFRERERAEEQRLQQQRNAARIWRRQDYYERRRRNVRNLLRQQLGREPTMDEFIAGVAHLRLDREWSDDE